MNIEKKEPFQFELSIPLCPDAPNKYLGRKNHNEYRNKKKYWLNLIWKLSLGKRPAIPLEKFKIVIVRHSERMLDYDGLVGSIKGVVDGLKDAKVIKDDSWKRTGVWDISQEFRPRKLGKLLVIRVIEDI